MRQRNAQDSSTARAQPVCMCMMHHSSSERLARVFVLSLLSIGLALGAVGCGDDGGEADDANSASTNNATTATNNATTSTNNSTTSTNNASTGTNNTSTGTTNNGSTGTNNSTNAPSCPVDGATDTLLAQGSYFVAISLEPFGGLPVYMQLDVVASDDAILSADLYPLRNDGTPIEGVELAAFQCDIAVDADGNFVFEADSVELPSEATPTGTDAVIEDLRIVATIGDGGFCGGIEGAVPLFGADLAGSTFNAVPLGTESDPPQASCDAEEVVTYDRLAVEECPVLEPGENVMVSAELNRTFRLYVPENLPDGPVPMVMVFHGIGGEAGFAQSVGFYELADTHGFIVVAPDGANDADGEQVFPLEWSYVRPWFSNDNQDLVFVDDMLTCVTDAYDVDDERIYVAGMSGGGLFGTFVGLHRSTTFAAAAPASGGYTLEWPTADTLGATLPFMVTWGGENDEAYNTPFHELALEMIDDLLDNGHSVIACNHGQDHRYPAGTAAQSWAWFEAYAKGDGEHPFVTEGVLPEVYPDYCFIPSADE